MAKNEVICNKEMAEEDDQIDLVVQGQDISVHEKILIRHSKYFERLFQYLTPKEEIVILKHNGNEDPLALISYTTMKTIVDFFYSGVLCISESNFYPILQATELLELTYVEIELQNYLKSNLKIKNCVIRYVLIEPFPKWKTWAIMLENFILINFSVLAKRNEGDSPYSSLYKHPNFKQFMKLISSSDLNIKFEEEVYEAILDWIAYDNENRSKYKSQLLSCVQWHCISHLPYLKNSLKDLGDMSNEREGGLKELLTEALAYHGLDESSKIDYWKSKRKPSRWPKLIVLLSYADKLMEYYDFQTETWNLLTEKPGYVYGAKLGYGSNNLYAIGGVQSKTVDQYDVETDTWSTYFPSLNQFRVAHGVINFNETIYVVGGSAKASSGFGPGLNQMEILNPRTKKWEFGPSMDEGRSFLGTAHLGSQIFVIGGCLGEDASTGEIYDSNLKKWKPMEDTLSKQDSCGCIGINNSIYAIGGFDNNNGTYLKTVEKYSLESNEWSFVKSMSMSRRSPGVEAYRGLIYVIGGMGQEEDLKTMEVYNPVMDQWKTLNQAPKELCGWLSSCLIEKPLRFLKRNNEIYIEKRKRHNKTSKIDFRETENGRTNLRMKQRADLN